MKDPRLTLKKYFGYDDFKPGQEEVIERILGKRDVLAVMPTGGGKSICYQIPALLGQGVTLVISPLIALMKDQVDALNQNGIAAVQISSSLTMAQTRLRLAEIARGKYKMIYVAPERLQSENFNEIIKNLPMSLVAIDEAHCVSQWGHDFRPSYVEIAGWISTWENRPVVAAFTATATGQVRRDISSLLQLHDPYVHIAGFDRPNLHFGVLRGVNKTNYIKEYLQRHKGESGIIYAATRREVDELHSILQQFKFKVGRYHAGLMDAERSSTQDDFLNDRIDIIVATNAFGLGIDKSNVRFVMHHNMPRHLEAYYQEAGRAGRDGLASECFLLFSPADIHIQKYLIENSDLTPDKKTIEYAKLQNMIDYCYSSHCLRGYMLNYFGEYPADDCGNCSSCGRDYEITDITVEAQKILSCVKRMNERFGMNTVAEVLRGAKTQKIRKFGFESLSTYGIMKNFKADEIIDLINLLIAEEYLTVTEGQYPILQLTRQAYPVLKKQEEVLVRRPRKTASATADDDLFQILKTLRLEIAREVKVPPFVVFHDSTLREMSLLLPMNEASMLEITGMGERKFAMYGTRFLEAIQDYVEKAGE